MTDGEKGNQITLSSLMVWDEKILETILNIYEQLINNDRKMKSVQQNSENQKFCFQLNNRDFLNNTKLIKGQHLKN